MREKDIDDFSYMYEQLMNYISHKDMLFGASYRWSTRQTALSRLSHLVNYISHKDMPRCY